MENLRQSASVILTEIENAKRARNRDAISDLAKDAIGCAYRDLIDVVKIGIVTRDCGLFDLSRKIFQFVLNEDANNGFAYYEMAWSYLLDGDQVNAFLTIEKLIEIRPEDTRAISLAIRISFNFASHSLTLSLIERLANLSPSHIDVPWMIEFNNFITRYPEKIAALLCRRIEGESRYISAHQVYERVQTAVKARQGFSVIRLGDGEGAFLRLSDADEAEFSHLYKKNRLDRSHVWFKGTIDIEGSGFSRTAFGLANIVQNTDVVGLPYASWINHEYQIVSPTGVSTLLNVFRVLMELPRNPLQWYASQRLHIDLAKYGYLEQLIKSQSNIGLIACHSTLPDRIAERYGVQVRDFYKIPGEQANAHIIGEASTHGAHFPDIYESIMDSLSCVDLSGRLFLVAGGILGKFYCDQIKKSGGVAVDIGSLADAWVGAVTRPGYEALGQTL